LTDCVTGEHKDLEIHDQKAIFILFYLFAYIVCVYHVLLVSQRLWGSPVKAIGNAVRKNALIMIKTLRSEDISDEKKKYRP
jgi:hypothetical protein